MAIDPQDLITFVLVLPTESVAQVRTRLPSAASARNFTLIVLPVGDGRYIVEYWGTVEAIVRRGGLSDAVLVSQLPGLPAPSAAVEIGANQQEAERTRDRQPKRRLVVLRAGAVVGLLVDPLRDSDDPFAPSVEEGTFPQVLGGEVGADTPTTPPADPASDGAPAQDDRVINSWVEPEPSGPLIVEQSYYLKFNVDAPRKGALTAQINVQELFRNVPKDVQQVEVLVVLDTSDFRIESEEQLTLMVPRQGKSKTITFEIVPTRNGLGVLRALFFANGRMFQKMTISLQVGPVMQVESSGLTLGSAVAQPFRRRDETLNLTILKEPAGYKFLLQAAGVSRASLNLSEAQIADWIKGARQALYDIVFQRVDGKYISQLADTTIAPAVYAENLKKLAAVGTRLYNGLFYDSGDLQSQAMGDLLRELSHQNALNVRVVAERFTFPWALLYDGDDPDRPEPDCFWGFKHIIEYLPEFTQPNTISYTPQIAVKDMLAVAFVCNNAIDAQFKTTVMADQQTFLSALPGVAITQYPTTQDLINLLKDPNAPPLIYFYCHAESNFPGEVGGVDDSSFTLTDRAIKLGELKLKASNRLAQMGNAPLVFVNACEGAELSPYLYDGLVPYLVQRGARGVIGTEVKTPVLFGAEFGSEFMRRFTAGDQPLGVLLRDMRRSYRDEKHNVLGLVYSLYSSGDVVVRRDG